MHGSSTGGKDSPFISIWEKTVNGAQKFFGLDKPLEEIEESEDDAAKSGSQGNAQTGLEGNQLAAVPGFGGILWGRFTNRTAGLETAFSAVSSSRIQPASDRVGFGSSEGAFDSQQGKIASARSLVATGDQPISAKGEPALGQQALQQTADGKPTATGDQKGREDSLSLNAEKAKEALSEAVKRGGARLNGPETTGTPVKASGTSSSTASSASSLASSSEAAKGELSGLALPKTDLAGEVAGKDAPTGAAAKPAPGSTPSKGGRANESIAALARSQISESGVEGASPSERGQNANTQGGAFGKVVSDIARSANPNAQNQSNASGTPAPNGAGVTAAPLASAAGNGAGPQSQNGGTGDPGKHNLVSALKSVAQAKGSEKGSADSGQAFDVKISRADAGRRSAAASKASQSSYVSKTASELKEVVATLTKSIDRLVTTKAGTLNLRVNFDKGGSMTIRIAMDGSQVSTKMQTDVPGLEGLIKSNWAELASDWNQKGIKLNTPQFQGSSLSHGDGDSRGNAWNEFAQREQEREARGFGGLARGRTNSSAGDGSAALAGENQGLEDGLPTADSLDSPAIDGKPANELKTYA